MGNTELINRRNFLKGSAIISSLALARGFWRAAENGYSVMEKALLIRPGKQVLMV